MKKASKRLAVSKPRPRIRTAHPILLVFTIVLALAFRENALGNDLISGYNSLIFRSYSDLTFKGSNGVRQEVDNDHYTFYDFLNIRQIRLHQSDGLRVFGSGSGWLRLDFGDKAFDSQTKADLSFASLQIDRGRTEDGFIRLGRLYNYQGVFPERFDGAEFYLNTRNGFEYDVYSGRRPLTQTPRANTSWLTGGRVGYLFSRRNTIGLSWLLGRTDEQWDDQKLSGDCFFSFRRRLYMNGYVGYDIISKKIYEIDISLEAPITRACDLRLGFDYIIPGLLIPKTSIFSVYSLAEERSWSLELIYRAGERWTFSTNMEFIDYRNRGGMGGPNNFFTKLNSLDGGYQWRVGGDMSFQRTPRDRISFRFEKLLEAEYGYTITDLIRTDFDFRNYNPNNPSPEQAGLAYGSLENGFASIALTHWHQWSAKLSHTLNFYYYTYDRPLNLHQQGDDSFATNLTLSYKVNSRWGVHLGGRYIGPLSDDDELQSYARLDTYF